MASQASLPSSRPSAPTINDLRVRLCWVCRDEEEHGAQAPKRWVHPCKCTLIAHESCLLQWIKAAQESRDRSRNALKCPQCGAHYQLESRNPLLLRILDAANRAASRAGNVITVVGLGSVALTCAGGVYLLLASYGGVALKEYLGRDYFTFVLSDDPGLWSWSTWLSFPLIPVSLILSRIPMTNSAPSVPSTLLLLWSAVFPVPEILVPAFPGIPARAYKSNIPASAGTPVRRIATTPSEAKSYFSSRGVLRYASIWPLDPAPLWPPSPTLICLISPAICAAYRAARTRLIRYVADSSKPPPLPAAVQRFVDAFGGEGAQIDIVVHRGAGGAAAAAAGEQQPNQEQRGGVVEGAGANADGDVPERMIRITGASFGRLLGGALATPYIASAFGSALLRLSHRSRILRMLLATRPDVPRTAYTWDLGPDRERGLVGALNRAAASEGLTPLGLAGVLRVFFRLVTFGHRAWLEADPVWWRNTLGLGLFIVLKDAVKIVHLWLAKQELESRHLKDRDFAGIDPKELDLIHPWPSSGAGISVAR